MFIRRLHECECIVANDGTELRELFHPGKDGLPLGWSLAHAVIPPGRRSLRHHLEGLTEVYYLLAGQGRMHIDDAVHDVAAGDAIVIPAGAIQYLENTGDVEIRFLAMVEPAWEASRDVRDE